MNCRQSPRAVVQRSGEHHPDHALASVCRDRLEEQIDGSTPIMTVRIINYCTETNGPPTSAEKRADIVQSLRAGGSNQGSCLLFIQCRLRILIVRAPADWVAVADAGPTKTFVSDQGASRNSHSSTTCKLVGRPGSATSEYGFAFVHQSLGFGHSSFQALGCGSSLAKEALKRRMFSPA
jgi:hypothetical protein